MAKWKVYDFVDRRGINVIQEWRNGIERRTLAKVDARIQLLSQIGPELGKTILSDTEHTAIKKLRIRGRTNPRILLCRGPIDHSREFTLLNPVFEKDNKMPTGAISKALERRDEVVADPKTRRKEHEVDEA